MRGDNRTRHNREIERKFLVEWLPDNLKRSRSFVIEQGYLATESGRQTGPPSKNEASTASLTFKVGRGSHREEREIKLSPKQFAALWPGTAGRRLRKVRYEIPWENLLIELDIYRGRHAGLVVAEVEFPDTCQLPQIQSTVVVWAGSDRRKTLQQRASRPDVEDAMAFRLKLREPLPEGLKRVFCEQIDSALHLCQNPAKQRGVTVHEVRKHLKKLRAAMRLAIGAVGKNCHAEEDRCVRKIGRLVSDLRDAQVRLQTFIQLRDKAAKNSEQQLFPRTEELLVLERESFSAAFAGWQQPGDSAIGKRESAPDVVATGRPELETNLQRGM